LQLLPERAQEEFDRWLSQSPYGAKWFATGSPSAPLLPKVGSQSPYGAKWFATGCFSSAYSEVARCRNPLTGLSGLQLYPPKNALLDGTAGGGVCEKDEAWNMHRPRGGRFAGFRPMGRLRKKGQGRMHRRISPSPWEETGFQGPLPDTRDEDIIALSGNGVPSTKVCRERRKEGYYTLRKREEMPSPRNKADGGSN
jgi:hypothetical protein